MPGDIGDQHSFVLKELDHNIMALTECTFATIGQERFIKLVENNPRVVRALWWSTLVDDAVSREWLVNIGQRQGPKRIAHLLCELLMRLEVVGLVTEGGYALPITQSEIGETLGLTAVHVNRVMNSLRQRKLITWNNKTLGIPDIPRLKEFAGFTSHYLHLQGVERAKDAAR